MDGEKREALERLQSMAEDDNFHSGGWQEAPNLVSIAGILASSERIELSHAGGDCRQCVGGRAKVEMVLAYLRFCAEPEMPMQPQNERSSQHPRVEEIWELDVVDMFETKILELNLDPSAQCVAPALILKGLMPCAPTRPSVALKMRVLEAYHMTKVRCPQLAIQSWVKALCDIHGVAYKPYLCQQFTIAYDLYLDIRQRVDERVMKALGWDTSWCLKHACPACNYKLEGEDQLIFDMLMTMDGNDSLKRVLRREKASMEDLESEESRLANSQERVDNRNTKDGYFLSREKVDKWAKTRLEPGRDSAHARGEFSGSDNPCADRWKNMVNDVTSKMWGIFDETGIFLALCRHGFVLVLADMIRSGELAKYPLAVIKELLDIFGMNIGAGYDVGCHFGATVSNSELGNLAKEKNLKCLVGSFHGHAHNRLCQLSFLATYVEGMGLEDLEGCEHFFSRSNGLAKSCRYASRFHRQQEISTYVKHFDTFETYTNLSKFLCTNYRQALTILKTEPALASWMHQEGVKDFAEFHQWLLEEKVYLLSLKNSPKASTETLEMEYVQKLAEIARRHAKEKVAKDLDCVQELENMLEIVERWTTASPKWSATVEAIKKRKYQLALDALELLIVERIFELTKMNRSQTGYKMRKHIAKALQARLKAVKNAIEQYNAAAILLSPPMPELTWEQVVEYTFLADFDILQDTRAEIQSRPWTHPSYRLAMDHYFKILRAREEIKRLNVEIPQVVTWIRDENQFLRAKERELRQMEGKSAEASSRDIQMAVQVQLYQERRGRFDDGHMRRFWRLAEMPGFTGCLRPRIAVERREARDAARAAQEQSDAEEQMDMDEVVVAARGNWWQAEEEEEEAGWEDEEEHKENENRVGSPKDSDDEGEGEEA
ncbi:hypothetical protein C8R43DRAFT_1091755 [Mycena crocata]|nr:hypothetical protein C8R43DRAFT_1091755 [Mycena crocata]